ncbi:MAG TPA: tetratricopeptide repeat protein [Phycisphaerae bacterium]|nr:tetratricopeptide repeat protein [Phycisphaerae bacterium]HNU44117.1 tetratricopeptide repeat protein [Phycisphaerae bacterium]
MAKKLNKNLVVGLSLAAFALMIGLSLLMIMQLRHRDPEHFVDMAEKQRSGGNWEQAAVFYHRAWSLSGDAAYLVHAGQMLLNANQVPRAVGAWQEAVSAAPGLLEAHTKLVQLLLDTAQFYQSLDAWQGLQTAAEKMLEVAAEDAFAHRALGLALFALQGEQPDNAARGLAELEKAVELEPGKADYAIDLARCYGVREMQARRDDPATAAEWDTKRRQLLEGLCARLLEPSVDAAAARGALAEYLAGQGQEEEAERLLREGIELAGDDVTVRGQARLRYATFLAQRWVGARNDAARKELAERALAEAQQLLRLTIEEDPDTFPAYQQLASIYMLAGQYEEARKVCDARIGRGFSRLGLAAARNRSATVGLMLTASRACVALASSTEDLRVREEMVRAAQTYVDDARAEHPDHPAILTQAGKVKWMMGLDREALELLRRADDQYRSQGRIDWDHKLALARAHYRLSEPGEALRVLEPLARDAAVAATDVNFWVLYAEALYETGNTQRASQAVDHALALQPDNEIARRLRGVLYGEAGQMPQAQAAVAGLPDAERVLSGVQAVQLDAQQDADGMVQLLTNAFQKDPTDTRIVSTLVRLLLSLEQREQARAVVEQALTARPGDKDLAKLEVVTRTDQSADERDQALLGLLDQEEDGFRRAWDRALFHYSKDDLPQALQQINEAERHLVARDTPAAQVATRAEYRQLLTRKLLIAARLDDAGAYREVVEAAATHDVDGAGGKSFLGQYHMFREEADLAVQALSEAIRRQPTDARTHTYLGRCYESLNRTDEARAAYERALDINPREGLAWKGLALLAARRQDVPEFERCLDKARQLLPNDEWIRNQVLAQQDRESPEDAVTRRERQLAAQEAEWAKLQRDEPAAPPTTPGTQAERSERWKRAQGDLVETLLRLARLYEQVRDLEKADARYARLRELLPNDQDLVISISKYYLRTNRPEKSLELVQQNVESRRTPAERANAHIIVAAHYVETKNPGMVEATLLAAADEQETFEVTRSLADFYLRRNQPAKALLWFDKAVELGRKAESPRLLETMSARIGCILHRSLNDVNLARQRVDEYLAEAPDDPRGFFWESELYAREGRVNQAVNSLSRFLERRPNDANGLFQRAQYYLALGQPTAAMADLEAVVAHHPDALDLEPALLLAIEYQKAGRMDQCVPFLENLVKAHPESAKATTFLADIYRSQGRYAEAESLVTAQINREGERVRPNWYLLRGRIAYEEGDQAQALADTQRAVELSEFSPLLVASLLRLYEELGRPAEGAAYYGSIATRFRSSAEVLSAYAVLLAQAGRKAEAAAAFRQAAVLGNEESVTVVRLVNQDIQRVFSPEEGVAIFEVSGLEGPAQRANDRILAPLLFAAGRPADATARMRALVSSAGGDAERADLLVEQGMLCEGGRLFDDARAAYEEALRYRPDDLIALNNMAYILAEELKQPQRALPYAQQAAVVGDNPEVLDTLGWIYVGLGRLQPAIAELSKSVRLGPDAPLSYYHLAEAYRRAGQFREAQDVLNRGLALARAAGAGELVGQMEECAKRIEAGNSAG